MEIGGLITRAVLTVEETDSLRDAALGMMERGVGSAVVLAEDRPVGVITDREALRAIAQDLDANFTPVKKFLARNPTTVTGDVELVEAARLMRDRGFRHLIVVNGDGALEGVSSMRDLVVGLLQERPDAD